MNILILILATHRITLLLIKEDGPFYIFQHFRAWSGVYYDKNNKAQGTNLLSEILSCFYCCSLWIAIILTGLYWSIPYDFIVYLFLPFALSSGAILLKDIVNG